MQLESVAKCTDYYQTIARGTKYGQGYTDYYQTIARGTKYWQGYTDYYQTIGYRLLARVQTITKGKDYCQGYRLLARVQTIGKGTD